MAEWMLRNSSASSVVCESRPGVLDNSKSCLANPCNTRCSVYMARNSSEMSRLESLGLLGR